MLVVIGRWVVGQDIPAIVVRFISRSRVRATYRAGCFPLRKNRIHSRSQKQNTRSCTRSGNFWNQGHNKCRLQGLQNTFSYSFVFNRSSKVVRATRSPWFSRSPYSFGQVVRSVDPRRVEAVRGRSVRSWSSGATLNPSTPGAVRRSGRPSGCRDPETLRGSQQPQNPTK